MRKNRLHIYGTFDNCTILTIYYRYILVDGWIRLYLTRPKLATENRKKQDNIETIVSILNLSKKDSINLIELLRSHNTTNNRNSMIRLRENVKKEWPNIIEVVRAVMYHDINLIKLECVYYRWKAIKEYYDKCLDKNSLAKGKIYRMLNVISHVLFTSLLLVLKTVYRKYYNDIKMRPQTVNTLEEYNNLLTTETVINRVIDVFSIDEYNHILRFIFDNYTKLVEPVKANDICTTEYKNKINDFLNFK